MFSKFKCKSIALASVLAIFGFAFNASATPITTTAEILGNVTVTQNAVLQFGQITSGSTAGTVTLTTGGGISSSTIDIALVGGESAGEVLVDTSGLPLNTGITVTVTGGTLFSGGNTMTVQGNCQRAGGTASAINVPCTFNSTPGSESVLIGGELSVGANQPVGSYSGTMEVTAAF
jgi:Mat/Ecp fimbriae major subunit